MSRLSGTTSLVVPWTAAVVLFLVIVDEYCVLNMKNGRNEDVFVARRLGRVYDVSGRSDMTSYMGGETTSACWDLSCEYKRAPCIVFGANEVLDGCCWCWNVWLRWVIFRSRDGRISCQRRRPGKRWKLPKIRVCQLDSGVLVGSYKYLSLILILDQYYALDIKNGQNVWRARPNFWQKMTKKWRKKYSRRSDGRQEINKNQHFFAERVVKISTRMLWLLS